MCGDQTFKRERLGKDNLAAVATELFAERGAAMVDYRERPVGCSAHRRGREG